MENNFINRWKEGILSVTELQKIKISINSTWVIILGIGLGLVFMGYNARLWFWGMIILIGALVNTLVGLIGLYQKKKWLTKIEESMNYDKSLDINIETEVENGMEQTGTN